jgi:hypothetical protein
MLQIQINVAFLSSVIIIIGIILYLNGYSNYTLQKQLDCLELINNSIENIENTVIDTLTEQSECYFSKDYENAKSLFVSKLNSFSDIEIIEMPVYENYSTHMVILKGNPEKFLIHVSGTHGVEGFAGSAIQSSIVDYFSRNKLYTVDSTIDRNSLPTILFVHALNPYGFASLRRTNEDNIDINRNFLTEDQFAFVKNRDANFASYVDFDPFFNPTKRPFKNNKILNDFYSWLHVGYGLLQHSMLEAKTAMVAGNYFKQKGIGFGGFELSKSTKNLIEITHYLNITQNAKKLVFIDVHTGGGPRGVDTLLTSFRHDEVKNIHINDIFPVDYDFKTNKTIGGLKDYFTNIKQEIIKNDFANDADEQNFEKEKATIKTKNENHNSNNNNNNHKTKNDISGGYEFTMGTTTDDFCLKQLSPNLKNSDKICVTQVLNFLYIFLFIIFLFIFLYVICFAFFFYKYEYFNFILL